MVTPSPIKQTAHARADSRQIPLQRVTTANPCALPHCSQAHGRNSEGLSLRQRAPNRGQMLKIQRSSNGEVIFMLAGRLNEEHIAEMETLLRSEAATRKIVLDLKDLTLVDRDAVRFLERCEAASIKIKNCPAYIREWIRRERGAR